MSHILFYEGEPANSVLLRLKTMPLLNSDIEGCPSAYGAGGLGGLQPPCRKKNSIIRAKLMYRSGKDTVKNILLFNILIYLFSSRISPNLLTDLCTTSRDGCYYSELEH